LLLGTGTSITQSAMRELAKAGVLVGFCGGDGTPLFSGNEVQVDVSWLLPQSEYRPTEYLQQWVSFWFVEEKRVAAAKIFQKVRIEQIKKHWLSNSMMREENFQLDLENLLPLLENFESKLDTCTTSNDILCQEAILTKALYKLAATTSKYGDFRRLHGGSGTDFANKFLDHGNYLAYGMAATATWAIGLPHGLAILHGKTRRGGLVFDVADLIKDAVVLPQSFIAAMAGEDAQEFRKRCIEKLNSAKAIDVMIDTIKATAIELGETKK
jgi:CRISPR-associated protein Cas1